MVDSGGNNHAFWEIGLASEVEEVEIAESGIARGTILVLLFDSKHSKREP